MNLITWKWNFDYKIRYEEQCFSLPFLWIFQYKKVFFLKSNFLYTMDVSRNEEYHVSVTTSLFMALLRATLDKSIFLLSKLICSKYGCSTNWMRVREKEETNKFWGIVCDAETESYHIIYQIAYIQLYMREQNQVCQITISTNR